MSKIRIEIDSKGNKTVSGGTAAPLENLVLRETIGSKVVDHRILSISEGTVIRTNPNCYWTVVNGVPRYICT